MPTVSVRYIVDDVDAAIEFYCQRLGFRGGDAPGGDVRDAVPWRSPVGAERAGRSPRRRAGDARRHLADARRLESVLDRGERPRGDGGRTAHARCQIPQLDRPWRGGERILVEDPAGNPVERSNRRWRRRRVSPPA